MEAAHELANFKSLSVFKLQNQWWFMDKYAKQ